MWCNMAYSRCIAVMLLSHAVARAMTSLPCCCYGFALVLECCCLSLFVPCCCCVVFGVGVAEQAHFDLCMNSAPCRSSCPPPAAGHWATFTPLTGLLSTLLFLPLDSSIFLTKLSHRSSTLFLLLSFIST